MSNCIFPFATLDNVVHYFQILSSFFTTKLKAIIKNELYESILQTINMIILLFLNNVNEISLFEKGPFATFKRVANGLDNTSLEEMEIGL